MLDCQRAPDSNCRAARDRMAPSPPWQVGGGASVLGALMPPLNADGYLCWIWWRYRRTTRPYTATEFWAVFQKRLGMSREESRRFLVHLAAAKRRDIRRERLYA